MGDRDTNGGEEAEAQAVDSYSILVLGASESGKSALIKRFVDGRFEPSGRTDEQIVAEKLTKFVGKDVLLKFIDTPSGDPRQVAAGNWYREADGFLLVSDLTKDETKPLDFYARQIELYAGIEKVHPKLAVGTKADLSQLPLEGFEAKAEELGAAFVETSSLTGKNVESAMQLIVATVIATRVASINKALDVRVLNLETRVLCLEDQMEKMRNPEPKEPAAPRGEDNSPA